MANILNENFDSLKQLFTDCLNAKNNTKDTKTDLEEKIKVGSLSFVLIKKINRLVKYKVRSGREELQAQKSLVDCNRLHLQNLLYEVNYLKREIKQCYKFKSQDEDIDIYDPPEYKALAEALSHKERISRLERELNLRKQLSDDFTKLLNDKAKVSHEINFKTENLSTFAPSLRTLLKATRPLQDALELPIEQKWKLEHKVHMLPQNLYLTYVNLRAIELLEGNIELSVMGQEDDVKEFEAKISQLQKDEVEHSLLMKAHPLSLQIKLKHDDFPDDFITVDIYYLPLLMIATAHCDIRISENNMNETNLLQDFLKFINEDDMGESLPYSECSLNLQKHDLSLEEFQKYVIKNNLGKPYLWLQKMIGNSSFNNTRYNEMQTQKLKDFTLECVKRIRSYLHTRLTLIAQIRAFMNKNIDKYLNDKTANNTKPNCALVQWSAVSWEEYESSQTTAPFISSKLVDESGSFFRAVIVLSSAKMECLISISNKFPLNVPLWTITVHWNGHHNALNSSAIKIMEQYTNSIKEAKHIPNLLAFQLVRTMYSFDIFLETEGPLYQPLEYNKEKSFIKSFSKRIRMRPYKRIQKGSVNYFKQ